MKQRKDCVRLSFFWLTGFSSITSLLKNASNMLFFQGWELVKQITYISENVGKTISNADLDIAILPFLVSGALLSRVNCLSTRKLRSFSAKLFSSCITCTGAWGCSTSRAGLDTFLCWAPSDFCQPFPWLVGIPLNGSTILCLVSHFSPFVSSANLLSALYPIIQIINENTEQFWTPTLFATFIATYTLVKNFTGLSMQWTLSLLTVYLYSYQVTCACFHLLYNSF